MISTNTPPHQKKKFVNSPLSNERVLYFIFILLFMQRTAPVIKTRIDDLQKSIKVVQK